MRAIRKTPASSFERAEVEVSLLAIYLGLHVPAVHRHHGQLEAALCNSAILRDRRQLISQAESGMPHAIVPFVRRRPDVYLAASLMEELGRACFRSADAAVDAGYFMRVADDLRYVDAVGEGGTGLPEVLDPFRTRVLIQQLHQWTERPRIEIVDSQHGDFLRLHLGTQAFGNLQPETAARRHKAAKPIPARLSLLTVAGGQSAQSRGASPAPSVKSELLGTVTMAPDQDAWLIRGADSRIYIETHSAWYVAQTQDDSMFIHIEFNGAQFVAPLPDPLQFGATASGWLAPLRDISSELGGSSYACTRLPRQAAVALMRHTPWMWSPDLTEWALWAWWLQPKDLDNPLSDLRAP